MKRRQQTPRTVISVMRVPELNQITGDGKSGIRIGASVTLTDIVEHPLNKSRLSGHRSCGAHDLHANTSEHGNDRRQPPARHALQLLRSELRVAQRHKLLSEEGRRRLLGGAWKFEVLGSPIFRLGSGDGGDWREVSFGLDAW